MNFRNDRMGEKLAFSRIFRLLPNFRIIVVFTHHSLQPFQGSQQCFTTATISEKISSITVIALPGGIYLLGTANYYKIFNKQQ